MKGKAVCLSFPPLDDPAIRPSLYHKTLILHGIQQQSGTALPNIPITFTPSVFLTFDTTERTLRIGRFLDHLQNEESMIPKEAAAELEKRVNEENLLGLEIKNIDRSSWYFHEGFSHRIRFGTNLPLSPEEIEQIIGSTLDALAQEGTVPCVPLISPLYYLNKGRHAIYCGFSFFH